MRIALALLVTLAACQPDYSDTAFLCDATHGCPDGQTCLSGRCRRGNVIPVIACGPGVTCTNGEQCCVDGTNPPRCIAGGDACPGYGAVCDGSADCQTGDTCCYGGDLTYCRAECISSVVCTEDLDCPSSEPRCCPDADVVWGYCQFAPCS